MISLPICYIIMSKSQQSIRNKDYPIETETQAIRSLRVQIYYDPQKFITLDLIRDISTKHKSTKILVQLARILAMLPLGSQLLNRFISIISYRTDLTSSERFCFFQIKRIHLLRQSSVSRQLNNDFNEVKKVTSRTIKIAQQFWIDLVDKKITHNYGYFLSFYQEIQKVNTICLEAIDKYPNSPRFVDEYAHFLIECKTDFELGTEYHYIADQIEKGKHNNIDYAYRSFVNRYPIYLKEKILDHRGKKVIEQKKENGTSNSSNNNSSTLISIDDNEFEEEASKVMDHSKLRLALQKALNGLKNHRLENFKITFVLEIILCIIILITFSLFFNDYFNTLKMQFTAVKQFSNIRDTISLEWYSFSRFLESISNLYITNDIKNQILGFDITKENLDLNYFGVPKDMLLKFCAQGMEVQNTFSYSVALFDNVEDYTALLEPYYSFQNCTYCQKPESGVIVETSGKALIGMLFQQFSLFSNYSNDNWETSKEFCQLINNYNSSLKLFPNQMDSIYNWYTSLSNSYKKTFFIIIIVISILVILICSITFIIPFYLLRKDLNYSKEIMLNVSKEAAEEASKTIMKTHDDNTLVMSSTLEAKSYEMILLPIFNILFIFGIIISCITLYIALIGSIDVYNNISIWYILSHERNSYLLETMSMGIISSIITKSNFPIEPDNIIYTYSNLCNITMEIHNRLISTDNNINGYSTLIDDLHFISTCDNNDNISKVDDINEHNNYKCNSINQMMILFQHLQIDTLKSFNELNPLETSHFQNLIHLIEYHLYPKLLEINSILNEQTIKYEKDFITFYFPLYFCLIIVCLIFVLIQIKTLINLIHSFEISKSLIGRLSPQYIVSNHKLLNYVLDNSKELNSEKSSSAEQSVINSSTDAILAFDQNLIIELMNPAVSTIFGYTVQQLLGQSITTILPINKDPKNSQQFYQQINLMKSKQVPMTYSCKLIGEKDDENEILLNVTLLGINNGESFALIMNDMTIAMKAQKDIEEAKKKAEKLLYQILPRDIVNRINQGETEISFSVPIATITFIDIVKFSEYSATLSAKQIMTNLGMVFKSFDSLLTKYKTIIKIKLIGDVYMAAAGLFNQNLSSDVPASEMVSFAIDVLHVLDEINHGLESNLQVRIGINTGGPLIAGVLGIDKPLFDIIGDPINVASRLQSNSLPNHIQISQATCDLIKNKGFVIEERGKIQLKGKGLQMAYFVGVEETSTEVFPFLS